ncbi:His Kinase A (phospho-acceptor) domain [Chlamydia trachomatis]|nr:His Kinase A (phospho-acceptor) domain [Chlamydia trachomatis]
MTNVSHELKTPIAAIANMSELLQDSQLDEASRL